MIEGVQIHVGRLRSEELDFQAIHKKYMNMAPALFQYPEQWAQECIAHKVVGRSDRSSN
jgi:hypothetical protein